MSELRLCLGLESSCDETAAAIVGADRSILSSVVYGQADLHEAYGGVVPEIAARAHAERLDICVAEALREAGVAKEEIDLIAVTAGPGLIGGVMSAVVFAKALAVSLDRPMLGVNHLAGHALTPRLTDGVGYPYILLLVSGGHCQFLAVMGPDSFVRIGGTIDDAPGEAFDKTAKLLGLGYPGGPLIEKAAVDGDASRFAFPRPLLDRPGCDMSFSGLKTAVRRARDELVAEQGGLWRKDVADLAAGFQTAVADVLAEKTRRACEMFLAPGVKEKVLAIAGGVAANKEIGARLAEVAAEQGFRAVLPPLPLCTDNAAMIAWAGLEQYKAGARSDMGLVARPRWPLDEEAAPLIGSGKKGAKA